MSSALDRLKNLTSKITSYEKVRKNNILELKSLFHKIGFSNKVEEFDDIFEFKAINLSGASLAKESLGEIKKGKYLQVLAISYDKEASVKSKNISLGYFGKSENVDTELKDQIIEFIIRYRFEKSFITLEHYNTMLKPFNKDEHE